MKAYFIIINTVIPCSSEVLYIFGVQGCASILIPIFQLGKLKNRETKITLQRG